ncbi:hypothetical protein TNCV_506821 [Trichonephila clavipes]|nr:hypothetical protein TNCV_506821 [Trichonephila clavipes]
MYYSVVHVILAPKDYKFSRLCGIIYDNLLNDLPEYRPLACNVQVMVLVQKGNINYVFYMLQMDEEVTCGTSTTCRWMHRCKRSDVVLATHALNLPHYLLLTTFGTLKSCWSLGVCQLRSDILSNCTSSFQST